MTTLLRVLLVEDSLDDALLLTHELRVSGYDLSVERVDSADAMRAALAAQAWDLVISDYSLPRFSALGALQVLHASGHDIPCIVVSGTIDEATAVEVLKAGAHDFVLKDNLARLIPAIQRELREAEVRRQRRQAEAALHAAEAKYRSLVEQIPAIVYIVTLGDVNRTTYISPQVEAILGFTPEEWLADIELWKRQLHPEDRERVIAEQQRADTERRGLEIEYRVLTKDGRVRWFNNQTANVLNAAGEPELMHGILLDITDRKAQEQELEAVAALSTALRQATTRAEILPIVVDQMADQLEAEAIGVGLQDPATGDLVFSLTGGRWRGNTGLRIPAGEGLSSRILATGEAFLSNQPESETRFYRPDQVSGLRAVAGVPLVAQGKPLGALWLGRQVPITQRDLRSSESLADLAASAIHRATLFEQTERRLHQLAALRAIDQTINASLDLRFTLRVLLDQVTSQLGVDAASVLLLDARRQVLEHAAGRGFRSQAVEQSRFYIGEGYAGRAALDRRIIAVPGNGPEAFAAPSLLAREGFVAYYAVPLIVKGRVAGVMQVFNRTPLQPDQDWLDFLEALAGQAALAIDNSELFDGLQRANLDLAMAYDATLEGWSRALDLRDRETEGHTQRVTNMTLRLAELMGLTPDELVHVRRGALLHDIGKMGIPDHILLKPGPLNDDEWEIMRRHPTYAFELLSPIAYLRAALDIPYCHHEKWDGTGYPRRLKGPQIPLAARIFAIVDIWDALRYDRPYRPGWPEKAVRDYIQEQSGTGLDPMVVQSFWRLLELGTPSEPDAL